MPHEHKFILREKRNGPEGISEDSHHINIMPNETVVECHFVRGKTEEPISRFSFNKYAGKNWFKLATDINDLAMQGKNCDSEIKGSMHEVTKMCMGQK